MKKICYFINSDWYFDLHWLERAVAAKKAGYEVHILTHFFDDKIKCKFKDLGFTCHNVDINAQSFNACIFIRAFYHSIKIIRYIKPDLIHCITIKPCLIGGFLAKLFNLPVVVSFVGLGRVFSSKSLIINFLRKITVATYKLIASNKKSIFMFEHAKDKEKLLSLINMPTDRAIVIDGAGINTDVYKYSEEPENRIPVVLFASRVLWSKGLGDLVKVKEELNFKGVNFQLNVAGILVEDDKDAIPLEVINKWHSDGSINWLGQCSNVYKLIRDANIVALPSVYPEGIPRILLEACSVGRACVAYDSGGCDSLIKNDENGLIIKSNTVNEMADKLEYLLLNPSLRKNMGLSGREIVLKQFSSKLVINKTLCIYKKIFDI